MTRYFPVKTVLRGVHITLLSTLFLWGAGYAPMTNAMAAQEMAPGADTVILRFHDSLLSVMQHADKLGYQGRYAKLDPEIRKAYNLPLLARLTLGSAWQTLTPAQQKQFVDVFSRLVIATYAKNFDGYSGERFQTVSKQTIGHAEVVIHTTLSGGSNGDVVQLDYILRQFGGTWRIINVIADGASDLALKRADYTSILQSQGFNNLIGKLEEKITRYQQ
jgi:phospholipid transport system substrate-binding protein